MSIVYSEYIDLQNKGVLFKEYSPDCCKIHMMFGIPCRHLLLQRINEDAFPLLSISDFPDRFLRNDNYNAPPEKNETSVVECQNEPNNYSYSNCVARFEKYFSCAARSEEIRNILDKCINDLQTIEHQTATESEILPPSSIPLSGCLFTRPKNNVDFKSTGGKKKYHCSLCGETDHTLPRCPKATNS